MKKLMKKLKEKKGFTLIEMIIVIAIIAVLIALIAPNLQKYLNTAKQTTANAGAKTIYTSANAYLVELYTEGKSVPDGTWTRSTGNEGTQGNDYGAATFIKEYLNESELGDNASFEIIIKDGVVQAVMYNDGSNNEGYYPDKETYNAAAGLPITGEGNED